MGNFDDIESNDFMLPNGTELNENATRTERDIFYNFGQHCKFIYFFFEFLSLTFEHSALCHLYDDSFVVGIKFGSLIHEPK